MCVVLNEVGASLFMYVRVAKHRDIHFAMRICRGHLRHNLLRKLDACMSSAISCDPASYHEDPFSNTNVFSNVSTVCSEAKSQLRVSTSLAMLFNDRATDKILEKRMTSLSFRHN